MLWSDRVASALRPRAARMNGAAAPNDASGQVGDAGGQDAGRVTLPAVELTTEASALDAVAAATPRTMPGGWRMVDRRGLLRLAGTATLAAPAAGVLAACGGSSSGGGQRAVRIGYVSPQTGRLRNFKDVDAFVLDSMREFFRDGMQVGGSRLPVKIISRDSQSDRNRAASAANDLIFADEVDIMLVGGSADTVNPVADQCEANGVPCISTFAPWQSWYYGRGGNDQTPFIWTYHFFWGMEELIGIYTAMWGSLDVPRTVGALLPHDLDGDELASERGLPLIANSGYTLAVPFRYQPGTDEIRGAVDLFRTNNVTIVTGAPSSEDFATFWREVNDQDYLPEILTISKALLFSDDVTALGSTGDGLSTEVGWSPKHQNRSFLTNQTSQELAASLEETRGAWVQTLGFTHALFEVAAQALASVDSLDDPQAIADAIGGVNAKTIVGTIAFGATAGVPKNVARTPLVGGQWRQANNVFNLAIVNNVGTNVELDSTFVTLRTARNT